MTTRKFGRFENIDERDKLFPVATVLTEAPDIPEKYWWADGWWGNQGSTSQCVIYSWSHWLEDGPVIEDAIEGRSKPMYDTDKFYHECQIRDPWPGECVDMKTSCMTRNGWKTYDELIIGEDILTLNVETKLLEFKPINNKFLHKNKTVREYSNKGIAFVVTENHKWPVSYRGTSTKIDMVETKNLNSSHEIIRASSYSGFPSTPTYSDAIVKLVGWVITEGSFRPEYRRGNGIIVSQRKYKKELMEVLLENSITSGVDKDGLFICEFSGNVAKEVREICDNKNVDYNFIYALTKKQILLLVKHMELGDGSHIVSKGRKDRKQFHQTIHNGNVLEIWQLCQILLGNAISRSNVQRYNMLDGNTNTIETWSIKSAKISEWRKIHHSEEYTADVWCPNTDNGTFIACRDSSIFITGNSYDGTSVRAGAKILKELDIISEYRWATTINEVANTLLTLGPMVVGTKWYSGMNTPNSKGIIRPNGSMVGGHAYLIDGIDNTNKYLRIKNSWGKHWGKSGYAFISFKDFEKLLKNGGEACIAFKRKIDTVPELSSLKPV